MKYILSLVALVAFGLYADACQPVVSASFGSVGYAAPAPVAFVPVPAFQTFSAYSTGFAPVPAFATFGGGVNVNVFGGHFGGGFGGGFGGRHVFKQKTVIR